MLSSLADSLSGSSRASHHGAPRHLTITPFCRPLDAQLAGRGSRSTCLHELRELLLHAGVTCSRVSRRRVARRGIPHLRTSCCVRPQLPPASTSFRRGRDRPRAPRRHRRPHRRQARRSPRFACFRPAGALRRHRPARDGVRSPRSASPPAWPRPRHRPAGPARLHLLDRRGRRRTPTRSRRARQVGDARVAGWCQRCRGGDAGGEHRAC